MYPYLEPHGFTFKINRQPLDKLSDKIVHATTHLGRKPSGQ